MSNAANAARFLVMVGIQMIVGRNERDTGSPATCAHGARIRPMTSRNSGASAMDCCHVEPIPLPRHNPRCVLPAPVHDSSGTKVRRHRGLAIPSSGPDRVSAVKASPVHPRHETDYRARNRRRYGQGPRARGDVTIRFSRKTTAGCISKATGARGGQRPWSDLDRDADHAEHRIRAGSATDRRLRGLQQGTE